MQLRIPAPNLNWITRSPCRNSFLRLPFPSQLQIRQHRPRGVLPKGHKPPRRTFVMSSARYQQSAVASSEPIAEVEEQPKTESDPLASIANLIPRSSRRPPYPADRLNNQQNSNLSFGKDIPELHQRTHSQLWSPQEKNQPHHALNHMMIDRKYPARGREAPPKSELLPLRLNASTGRTISINPNKGVDLLRGLGMLNAIVARNRIRRDTNRQRFHERPGLKRKRLKRARKEARFMTSFLRAKEKIMAMKDKGW